MAQPKHPTPASIKRNGVVGAGGAGFPSYAKLLRPAEVVVVNAAECEPLMHKDKEILKHFAVQVLEGLQSVRNIVGAREGIIGIKEKYVEIIAELKTLLDPSVRIHPLGDYYPTGDEFILVKETTGRIIPPGGLPLDVGVVVCNVETLWNIARQEPVLEKFLTVAGSVAHPSTVRVPIGTSYGEALAMAGGATVRPYSLLIGGSMMGFLEPDSSRPITKTCGGFLVLPEDHPLIVQRKRSLRAVNRIGKAACDQCSYCTELCPRYLLGHPIEPHKAMRGLVFSREGVEMVAGTEFCCECNLCSLYSCPEGLDPKNVCVQSKALIRASGRKHPQLKQPCRPHLLASGRGAPISRLMQKLGLRSYDNHGPLSMETIRPRKVVLPRKQHVGVPAEPTVRPGDVVAKGDLIADVREDQLGVPLHASISGRITAVEPDIVIEA